MKSVGNEYENSDLLARCPKAFLKGIFQARSGSGFNCIMEANEDEEDSVTNDQEMKNAKQVQSLLQSPASHRRCVDG